MNCTICKHYGDCRIWKNEKEFYGNYPSKLPGMNYHALFLVTENGVVCKYFEAKD
jgi:hypothetical protein